MRRLGLYRSLLIGRRVLPAGPQAISDLTPAHHTRVLIEQSRSLRLAGQIEPSRISIKWALAKAEEIEDRTLQANAHGEKAMIHNHSGEMEDALKHQLQAVHLHRQEGNRGSEGRCLGNLGINYRKRGEFSKAQSAYEQALAIHREVGDQHLRRSCSITSRISTNEKISCKMLVNTFKRPLPFRGEWKLPRPMYHAR